jgi:arylsulfatase A-like enzyme
MALAAASSALGAGRPNIVFLLADDLRADALGCAGSLGVQTPNLDRLAAKGTLFTNCFVTTSICAVSRASIFSGQYARRHGIYDFATKFNDKAWGRTYPALLKQAGYTTAFIGKFGVGSSAPTNTFDYWDGFNGQGRYLGPNGAPHLTRRMGESAVEFLRSQKPGSPFCLSISWKSPHAQDGAAREFPPDPADESLYADLTPAPPPSASEEAFARLPAFLQASEGRNRWQKRFATPEMRTATVRDYYRLITGMDRAIGDILAELESSDLAKNTVIVFTSDNGFYLGEHGLAGKWFMHEESIRIPLIVYDPTAAQSTRGVKSGALALNIDIAPSLLAWAGVPIPEEMQGISLLPAVAGKPVGMAREDFFYEHHFSYGGKIPDTEGVRTATRKYVRYIASEPVVEELFDLEADPRELANLASQPGHAETLAALRERWKTLAEDLR